VTKRNRPRTAAEATHRRRRHEYRTARNAPEAKSAGAAAAPKAAATAKPAAAKPAPRAKKPAAEG
jgi:hypothetical protein